MQTLSAALGKGSWGQGRVGGGSLENEIYDSKSLFFLPPTRVFVVGGYFGYGGWDSVR